MPFTGSLRRGHPWWLLAGFWICIVIALAAVVRRLFALVRPAGGRSPIGDLDAVFSSHAALTVAHIVPAGIFVVLAAAILLRRRSNKWLERLFFPFGAITGVTAYAMSAYAFGGWTERAAVAVFDTWFLLSLGRAFWFHLHGDQVCQRRWITRAVGVMLGIATTRPVMGAFFATSALTHLSPHQFFGIAFWIGFSINAVVVELWLHSKQRADLHEPGPVLVDTRVRR